MAVHKCGWCGERTHMSVFSQGQIRYAGYMGGDGELVNLIEAPFRCDSCRRLSVGIYEGTEIADEDMSSLARFFEQHDPYEWAPNYVDGQDFPAVPGHIAGAAGEAHRGESIGNHMSAILMARTVIEATAKDKGIVDGSLAKKIQQMVESELIRRGVKEVADEIRLFGNDMAHGDITEPATKDDAVEILALMDEILNEVYQGPARLAAIKARRLERKKEG